MTSKPRVLETEISLENIKAAIEEVWLRRMNTINDNEDVNIEFGAVNLFDTFADGATVPMTLTIKPHSQEGGEFVEYGKGT